MRVPKTELKGVCSPNKSKSVLIRLITILALNNGGVIKGLSESNDVKDILNALETIGFLIKIEDDKLYLKKPLHLENKLIKIKESGTVLRFLAILLGLYFDEYQIEVSGTLTLRKLYLLNEYEFKDNIYTIKALKNLDEVDLTYTSQNLSALLIYYSLKEDKVLKIKGNKSLSYALMTMNILNDLGANITFSNDTFTIKKTLIKYQEVESEDDMTSLSNLLILAALHPLVKVSTTLARYQEDKKIFCFLEEMGYYFKKEDGKYSLDHVEKKDAVIDLKNNIDLTMALVALAVFSPGTISFIGIKNLMYKEVDRNQTIFNLLLSTGNEMLHADTMIRVGRLVKPREVELKSFNDHRTAMMNMICLSKLGGTIDEVNCINKSFPEFIKIYQELGGEISDN